MYIQLLYKVDRGQWRENVKFHKANNLSHERPMVRDNTHKSHALLILLALIKTNNT